MASRHWRDARLRAVEPYRMNPCSCDGRPLLGRPVRWVMPARSTRLSRFTANLAAAVYLAARITESAARAVTTLNVVACYAAEIAAARATPPKTSSASSRPIESTPSHAGTSSDRHSPGDLQGGRACVRRTSIRDASACHAMFAGMALTIEGLQGCPLFSRFGGDRRRENPHWLYTVCSKAASCGARTPIRR